LDVGHRAARWSSGFSGRHGAPGIEYYLPLFFDELSSLLITCRDNTLLLSLPDIEAAPSILAGTGGASL